MDSVKKLIGYDLRDAKQVDNFHGVLQQFINGAKSAYALETFSGYFNQKQRRIEISITRFSDVMAPHSIDIAPSLIEAIVFEKGDSNVKFTSMAEASFYFHLRLVDGIVHFFRMYVYLKPGVFIEKCKTVWRCYFLDQDSRSIIIDRDNEHAIQYPVMRDIVHKRDKYEKRKMAKL